MVEEKLLCDCFWFKVSGNVPPIKSGGTELCWKFSTFLASFCLFNFGEDDIYSVIPKKNEIRHLWPLGLVVIKLFVFYFPISLLFSGEIFFAWIIFSRLFYFGVPLNQQKL